MAAQLALAERTLMAQATFRVRPSIGTAQGYDSNLFSTANNIEGDYVTRVTPAVETDYATPRWTLSGRGAVDFERFADHVELNSMSAGQRALAHIDYHLGPVTAFAVDADFSRSQNAADLNAETGLTFARVTAQRIGASAAMTRRLNPVTAGKVEYAVTSDSFAAFTGIRTHTAALGVERRTSSRGSIRAEYRVREFGFDQGPATSQAVSAGWTRTWAHHTVLSVDGGPSVAKGSPTIEGAVSLRNQAKALDLGVAYTRTQTTVFGLGGLVTAQSAAATMAWRVRRSLVVNVAPAVYRSEQETLRADVYRLSVGVLRRLSRSMSLDVAYDGAVQYGTLNHASAGGGIARHQLLVRFVAGPTPPGR